MWDQTVTVYHKTEAEGHTLYHREVISGVCFFPSETETLDTTGSVVLPQAKLLVFTRAAAGIQVGDVVTAGECQTEDFSGSPAQALAGLSFWRVQSARRYPFSSRLCHTTFLLD